MGRFSKLKVSTSLKWSGLGFRNWVEAECVRLSHRSSMASAHRMVDRETKIPRTRFLRCDWPCEGYTHSAVGPSCLVALL